MRNLSIAFAIGFLFMLTIIWVAESKKMTLEEAKNSVIHLKKPCQKKTNVTEELLDGLQKGEFPRDERLMCFMKCILTATKSMRHDEVQYDWILRNARLMLEEKYLPRVEHVVEVCRERVPATLNGCEIAWELGKCVWDVDSELILDP
ncbi:general odorant-binding protein 72-like isoform X1 [Megalopta genalis]|uniref:general odorant-binding protein 72-like isoform X1 n=1 Tax=Megalopta genalis TaxID=115081 RepID=UPI003FD3C1FE